ncbi:MAG: DUF885 domain-containing protein [Bacteroidetes bacterium]|nr:DUF885 domain-containing protein [Bacteroidota bacterium]
MKKLIYLALAGLSLASCNNNNGSNAMSGGPKYTEAEIADQSKKVNDFLDRKFDEAVDRSPEFASTLGLKSHYGDWNDRSDEHFKKEMDIQRANIDSLKKFKLDALDEQTKLSVRLAEEDLKRSEDGFKWRFHGYWISQMGGEHTDIPAFLVNVHRIDTITDAQAYISRLQKLGGVFDQVLDQLHKREEMKVIPPKFTFDYVTKDIKNFIAGCDKTDASNVLLSDFSTKVDALKIADAEKKKLKNEAKTAITKVVKPAYEKLLGYWTELDKKTSESNGAWALPDGGAYYAYCLRSNTTTDMTADQIFDTGTKEVARIHDEMRKIMKQVNFKSDSLQEFFSYLRKDPKFKYENNDNGRKQILADAEKYINTVRDQYLDKLFLHKPKSPIVVKAVEKFREASVAGAFYEQPSEDGSRPGRFYVNLHDVQATARYQLEALCYHEGIPGHHMQIALAQELRSIPKFRRYGGNTAYVEGWALYSEFVPKQMGLYQDPYSDFGRLSMEIFRAARLVVDAGIHSKHWTREQAINYFLTNTANTEADCKSEIERYFIWPGQATGYKVGMLKIMELRKKAESELGDKFDIRQFHDVVLMNGAVPLTVLEELVNKYIEKTKGEKKS